MKILIAGGGTGGHVFPGIALAKEFVKRADNVEIIFVGTKKGLEASLIPKLGFRFEVIRTAQVKGKSILHKIMSLLIMPTAFITALKNIIKYKPDIILGVGGYASFAQVLVGSLFPGYKTFIHEQNSIPGLANKVLGKFTDKIFISFEKSGTFFNKDKIIFLGNHIREEFVKTAARPDSRSKFTVCITGGSQGARKINSTFLEALKKIEDLAPQINIIHQTGKLDYEKIKEKYKNFKFAVELKPFFDDLWEKYAKSHIIISRSGAGICEIAAMGRASILIPYSYASYNHQEENAKAFLEKNACVLIKESELNPDILADKIKHYFHRRNELAVMELNAKKMAKPDAAKNIVDECINLIRTTNDER